MSEFIWKELKNRKLNVDKLLSFGFLEENDYFAYSVDLLDGQMRLNIKVSKDGKFATKVIDSSIDEEYVLHLVESAIGSFVGRVKEEYEEVLCEIYSKCYDLEVFKSRQAKSVISYVKDKYGDEPEYLWKKFPDNAIVRRKDNRKWYLVLLTVSKRKLGFDSDERIEIIDLRMKPCDVEKAVDNKKYFPGYHMNKKHWITVCLDDSVSFDEIARRIDDSFKLAMK